MRASFTLSFTYGRKLNLNNEHIFREIKIDPLLKLSYGKDEFTVGKSPKDGHCIVSSVIQCLKDAGRQCVHSKDLLIQMLEPEILNNLGFYGNYFDGDEDFCHQLEEYRNLRKYNSSICDVILCALANMLSMNFTVLINGQ